MRLLLDTHIFLWTLTKSDALSAEGWRLIEDESNALAVSAVSIWEIAIKYARRRGSPNDMPMSGGDALDQIRAANLDLLPVNGDHAAAVDALPLFHRDPFDRLLVAQAKSESMHLLTHDKQLAAYGDFVIVV